MGDLAVSDRDDTTPVSMDQVRLCLRQGRRAEAESLIATRIAQVPGCGEAWLLLGTLQLDRGDVRAALRSLDRAVVLRPDDPEAGLRRAVAIFRGGDARSARDALDQLVAVHPSDPSVIFHRGLLAEQARDVAAAVHDYACTLAIEPTHGDAATRLALIELGRGNAQVAKALLERMATPRPVAVDETLARACLELGDLAEAFSHAERVTQRAPERLGGWLAMGVALRRAHRAVDATLALTRARTLAPNNPLVALELACNLRDIGEFDQAGVEFARTRHLAPAWGRVRWIDELGVPALPADVREAESAVGTLLRNIDSLQADLHARTPETCASALDGFVQMSPFALHYLPCPVHDATLRFGDLAASVVAHAMPPSWPDAPDWVPLEHGGRLRVGFVSAELREHTITRYFASWIHDLDRERVEKHAWHLGDVRDAITDRLEASVDAFRHCPRYSLAELASSIRNARLDVLVYLDVGMDGRMGILGSLRLAPVQCAGYGHPVTTGLHAIDVFISGEAMEPANAQRHYRERLECLPGLGVNFPSPPSPSAEAPWVRRVEGRPLVMCLQSLFKLVPEFDDLVARIVGATDAQFAFFTAPRALLPRFERRIGAALRARGLQPDRHLVPIERRSHADYLAGIAEADLVLDSTVFSGGATSLDALSVGTPLVTLEGEFMRSRQSAAMLRLVDAHELIAGDADEYVRIAVDLCRDESRRRRVRAHLRQRSGALFGRRDVITALEALLWRLARQAAAGGDAPSLPKDSDEPHADDR